jgi:hypothetical protein
MIYGTGRIESNQFILDIFNKNYLINLHYSIFYDIIHISKITFFATCDLVVKLFKAQIDARRANCLI